jgi:tetratricopeptide (TPR) repeat protein
MGKGAHMNDTTESQQLTQCGCVICGSSDEVTLIRFSRTYVPGWTLLGLVCGILPFLIFCALTSKVHALTAPFCKECAQKRQREPLFNWGSLAGAILSLFAGAVAGSALGSSWPFVFGVIITGGIVIAWIQYHKSVTPHYVTFDRDNVVIETPGQGRMVLASAYSGEEGLRLHREAYELQQRAQSPADLQMAKEKYWAALGVYAKTGNWHGTSRIHHNLGLIYAGTGQYDDAVRHFESCLSISRDLKDVQLESQTMACLANLNSCCSKDDKRVECDEKSSGVTIVP